VNSAEHCSHGTEKTKNQEKKEKRYVFSLGLNVDSVVDDVSSGGREFHAHGCLICFFVFLLACNYNKIFFRAALSVVGKKR